jgi:flavin-dependent dehydrogenase
MPDVIVIGARCAGASTALLLARKGYEVLLVDRSSFPSDIPKGHLIHLGGPQRLAGWGLLDRVLATGAPPITKQTMDMGDFPLTGTDLSVDGIPIAIGPRRSELDEVLVNAAVAAGAELREEFAVHDFIEDGGRIAGIVGRQGKNGPLVEERASVVVGADGRNSSLARRMGPPITEFAPAVSCWYFTYWSGVPSDELEIRVRDNRATFAFPTNDGLFALFVAWPIAELPRVKADIEGEYMAVVNGVPELADRVAAGRREERFYGATQLINFLRRPYGAGWALVGDAGAHKDPFMALGISDALRDAEFLAEALDDGLSRRRPMRDAMEGYERRRNGATLPNYHRNLIAARLGQPPARELALRAALRDSPEETRRFYLAREGLIPGGPFFSEENLARIMARAEAPARRAA